MKGFLAILLLLLGAAAFIYWIFGPGGRWPAAEHTHLRVKGPTRQTH